LLLTVLCIIAGGIVGVARTEAVKRYLTACIGSYLFTRGFTYYFGGYPSEIEMYNMMAQADSTPLEFDGKFWMYVGIFVGSAIAFIWL
jgi:hypothetical protein